MTRCRVVVSGRVQGVFFRETCRRRADDEGVRGWITNRPDGRVEAEFEGDPAAVQRMVDWCRIGPPRADVRSVDVEPLPPAAGTAQGRASFVVR